MSRPPVVSTVNSTGWHAPPTHVPPKHPWPQLPQFFGSEFVSLHAPLQTTDGAAHAHEPCVQDAPFGQGTPHAPQFAVSDSSDTHAPGPPSPTQRTSLPT